MSAPTLAAAAPDRRHSRGRSESVDGGRLDDARGRTALDRAGRDLGVDWLMGGVHVEEGLADPRGKRDALSALRRQAERPSDAARRLGGGGRGAMPRPSRRRAARASTFSPIARPRPSRSTSSPPAGADCPTAARSSSRDRSIRPSASPPFAPPARTPSPSAPRRSRRSYAPGAGPLAAQLKAVLEDCGAAD